MRMFVRVVFGLNVLYQSLVGIGCLVAPVDLIGAYGGTAEDAKVVMLQSTFRLLGAYILFGGVISALIARDPDRHPALLPLMALLSVLTLGYWGIALGASEVNLAQAAVDLGAQALLLAAAVPYLAKARTRPAPAIAGG